MTTRFVFKQRNLQIASTIRTQNARDHLNKLYSISWMVKNFEFYSRSACCIVAGFVCFAIKAIFKQIAKAPYFDLNDFFCLVLRGISLMANSLRVVIFRLIGASWYFCRTNKF